MAEQRVSGVRIGNTPFNAAGFIAHHLGDPSILQYAGIPARHESAFGKDGALRITFPNLEERQVAQILGSITTALTSIGTAIDRIAQRGNAIRIYFQQDRLVIAPALAAVG